MQNNLSTIQLVECPRDAMQGWTNFIPTQKKIDYINSLLKVGFDTIDFGSFVSPKAIPQLADTKEVVCKLKLENSKTKLLAIVANERGALEAVAYDVITYIGFPFSISETFQQKNTNSSINESLSRVEAIQKLCIKNKKELVIYISMGFGNPYNDLYNEEILMHWINKIAALGIKVISLADTVGIATPLQISTALKSIIPMYKNIQIGVHLHSTELGWKLKVDAALEQDCTRFDGALKGFGGCPMASNELVGNMNSEFMIPYFSKLNLIKNINLAALNECSKLATEIFV